jgi:hypothetical protein
MREIFPLLAPAPAVASSWTEGQTHTRKTSFIHLQPIRTSRIRKLLVNYHPLLWRVLPPGPLTLPKSASRCVLVNKSLLANAAYQKAAWNAACLLLLRRDRRGVLSDGYTSLSGRTG